MSLARSAILLLAACAAGLSSTVAISNETLRQSAFIIADQDGYGTGECLSRESTCGRIIADSFCQSKGFKAHMAYRAAEPGDVTGSLGSAARPQPAREPQAYVILCR
jgi:hypothetical protein